MLMTNQLVGFNVGGDKSFTFELTDTIEAAADDGDGQITTISSVVYGDPHPTRRIFLAIALVHGFGDGVISSVTIDSIAATIHIQNQDLVYSSAIVSANLASDSTNQIVVTMASAGTDNVTSIGVYRVQNLSSSTAHDTDFNDADIVNLSVDIPEGGFVLAAVTMNEGAISTSGVTEDFEVNAFSFGQMAGGSASGLSEETGRAISFNGAAGNGAGVAASFR